MPPNSHNLIPYKVWFLWFQGIADAPVIVRSCLDSWLRNNPTWDIHVLCEENIHKYVSLDWASGPFSGLSKAHLSDLVRLELLARYGGVWVDATCFCAQPLEQWLPYCLDSGFFAFSRPGRDRIISNWFLASGKNNLIVTRLYKELAKYWTENDFSNSRKDVLIQFLYRTLNRNLVLPRYWFSYLVQKCFRVFPYYVFHYKFAELIRTDRECGVIWNRMPKISADMPHSLQHIGILNPLTTEIKKLIDEKTIPLYKLTWKYPPALYQEGCIVDYLIRTG